MKATNILLMISISYGLLFAQSTSMKEETLVYDKLFKAINEKRFGLDSSVFASIQDPFVAPEAIEPKTTDDGSTVPKMITYKLYGIIENQAKINNRWVKKGDMVNDLRLVRITNESAVLANAERTLTLTLSQKGTPNVFITTN